MAERRGRTADAGTVSDKKDESTESVQRSSVDNKQKVSDLLEEVSTVCLQFENSAELTAFLSYIQQARLALASVVQHSDDQQ